MIIIASFLFFRCSTNEATTWAEQQQRHNSENDECTHRKDAIDHGRIENKHTIFLCFPQLQFLMSNWQRQVVDCWQVNFDWKYDCCRYDYDCNSCSSRGKQKIMLVLVMFHWKHTNTHTHTTHMKRKHMVIHFIRNKRAINKVSTKHETAQKHINKQSREWDKY